jgi:hypothetical protein
VVKKQNYGMSNGMDMPLEKIALLLQKKGNDF